MPARATVALLVALVCALALVLVGVLALAVPVVHVRDAAILHGFVDLYSPRRHLLLKGLGHMADPAPYIVLGGGLAAVALVQRRGWRALAVLALLVATGATTQALKHLLAQPRALDWLVHDSPSNASWPSGHATAAMTLALCATLVAPRRLRWLAVLGGGAFALAVGYAILAMHWHYPSDVLGGYLVAGLWTALAAAALAFVEEPDPAPAAPAPRMWPVLTAGVAAAVAAVLLARQDAVTFYASERPSLVVGALVIAALALALPASTARL